MECFGEFLAADDRIAHPILRWGKLASVGVGNVLSQEKREQVIRLQEQPLWILATLVERPGAIATREEPKSGSGEKTLRRLRAVAE
jgi:hypothetical protein